MLKRCLNCNSKRIYNFLRVNNTYSLYKCNSCHIIFTHPQPKVVKIVNKSRYDSKEELESRMTNYEAEYQRAKKHILSIVKYKASGKYLDVGCSYGVGVKVAKELGFDAIGIEPTKRAANYAKKVLHVNVLQKTLGQAKFKSNSFDVVSLYDVLEHIPNLKTFLLEIRRILKPGGLLVIQSPNIQSFAFKMLSTDWNWLLVPNHLWHFSLVSLPKILMNLKFSIVSEMTEDSVYDFSSNFTSKAFHYTQPSSMIMKILRKGTYISSYAIIHLGSAFWSKFGKGGSLQVYAIKE